MSLWIPYHQGVVGPLERREQIDIKALKIFGSCFMSQYNQNYSLHTGRLAWPNGIIVHGSDKVGVRRGNYQSTFQVISIVRVFAVKLKFIYDTLERQKWWVGNVKMQLSILLTN